MSRQTPVQSPRGRPRSFDAEAAVERAMGVFWSRGYYATALPDLLRATKLSRGSLYAAFGDTHSISAESQWTDYGPTLPATLTVRAVLMVGADACWWPPPWNWLAMMLKLI